MGRASRRKKQKNLLERFYDRHKEGDVIVKSNHLTIFYDDYLQKITGVPYEETKVPDNFTFGDFMNSLFHTFPEITQKVLPGELWFKLNDTRPQTFDPVRNGDKIVLGVVKGFKAPREIVDAEKEAIEAEITDLIKRYRVNITLDKIKEIIFNAKGFSDIHRIVDVFSEKIEDPTEGNQVLNVLTKAWTYFPQKSLGGASPAEKPSKLGKDNPYLK